MSDENQQLIDAVIENIKRDIRDGDLTAVDELLKFLPKKVLLGYLPETALWNEYRKADAEGQWIEKYKPQQNHLDDNASFNGWMYETYGEEVDHVFKLAQTTKTVWTIVEGDEDSIFYCSGFRYVNRLGFIITENPYEGDVQVEVE